MEEKVIAKSESTLDKTTKPKTTRSKAKVRTVDDLSLSERVSIDNLCDWTIGFVSEENGKPILIDSHIKDYKRLTLAEVDSQVKIGNVAFCGVDGYGSHAAFKINDPLVREYVFGDDISPVQLTEDAVKQLFTSKNRKEFSERLSSLVVTESEKKMIAIMCSDKDVHPSINTDEIPSYMLAEIEAISGLEIG